ncbi:BCCT family transporter [Cellulosimicrobium cellulans]|uniref:BCCT family transporter n=1 Tax=Cellulosimicrobium cellulans TaxID=1710 RepID=UPI0008483B54|nr:BCCT family transporter [Cellulosimicrobium cellulans]
MHDEHLTGPAEAAPGPPHEHDRPLHGAHSRTVSPARRLVRRVTDPPRRVMRETTRPSLAHPALLPGIGVESTGKEFTTHRAVFVVAAVLTGAFIAWGVLGTDSLTVASAAALGWVSGSFGWMFSVLTIAVFGFMLWLGFGPYGAIRLGRDDEEPEFSRTSWIAMLFAAGMGVGLLFFGPYEPLTYFLDLPPAFEDLDPGSNPAMFAATSQAMFHWGPMAWSYYALVGGAIAYAAYRKGRSPLMSSLLEPIFGARTHGWAGAVIDVAAIIVTLFGTAVTLGIGALQIGRGLELVAGIGPLGNGAVVAIICVLTVVFIVSAVSGIKRGIRALSNTSMVLTGLLGIFVLVVGPTAFLLAFVPSALASFVGDTFTLAAQSAATSDDASAFMDVWTTYYWAWWVAWSPFVGIFVAKISRGRTLREFVTTVILAPSLVTLVWFGVVGGTTMRFEQEGAAISERDSPQDMLFGLLDALPLSGVTAVVAMVSIVLYFVTSADSAALVMGSLSQRGRPEPSRWVTITWGVALAGIAIVMLLVGGQRALDGLQSLVIVTALPFAFVLVLVMVAWARDLARDPLVLRRRYAREAIRLGVAQAIEDHGDDFVFAAGPTEPHQPSAGDWLDTDDPALTRWYAEHDLDLPASSGDEQDAGPHDGARLVPAEEPARAPAEGRRPAQEDDDRERG